MDIKTEEMTETTVVPAAEGAETAAAEGAKEAAFMPEDTCERPEVTVSKHLPVFGVGPVLCGPIILVTAAMAALVGFDILPFTFTNETVKALLLFAGLILIIIGLVLFFGADMGGELIDSIKHNHLKTNGTYKVVRNPAYSMILFACTGAVFMAHNPFLFVLPVIYYIVMTNVIKKTEEQWLTEQYGDEYIAYKKRVNRLLPWFPKKVK